MSDTRLCNLELRRKPTRNGGLVCISRGCEIRLGYGLSGGRAEDQLKRLIERDLEVVLLMLVSDYHDLLEDELVEHSTDVVGCLTVALTDVLGDVQRLSDHRIGISEAGIELIKLSCGV